MPIANIIDKRTHNYCSFPITAVIEPACMNNDIPGADQYDVDDDGISTSYEERPDTSVYLAINWANEFSFPVTLYLYDFGGAEDKQAALEGLLDEIRTMPQKKNDA